MIDTEQQRSSSVRAATSCQPASSDSKQHRELPIGEATTAVTGEDSRQLFKQKTPVGSDGNPSSRQTTANQQANESQEANSSTGWQQQRRNVINSQRMTVTSPSTILTSTSQKLPTLVTPNIAITNGDHLGSTTAVTQTLLNSLDVDAAARFDGLPSCTPISADRLLSIGLSCEVNPFFRNIGSATSPAFTSQQHQSSGDAKASATGDNDLDLRANTTAILEPATTATTTVTATAASSVLTSAPEPVPSGGQHATNQHQQPQATHQKSRTQLPKLNFNSQFQAAVSQMLSPYYMQLSPEQEAFLRSFPSPQHQIHVHHPLAGHEHLIDTNRANGQHYQVSNNFRPRDLSKQFVIAGNQPNQQQYANATGAYVQHRACDQRFQAEHPQQPANYHGGVPVQSHLMPAAADQSAQFMQQQVEARDRGLDHHHHQQSEGVARRSSAKENHNCLASNPLIPTTAHMNPIVSNHQGSPTGEYAHRHHQLHFQHHMNQVSPSALSALQYEGANGQPSLALYDPQLRNFYLSAHQQSNPDHQLQNQHHGQLNAGMTQIVYQDPFPSVRPQITSNYDNSIPAHRTVSSQQHQTTIKNPEFVAAPASTKTQQASRKPLVQSNAALMSSRSASSLSNHSTSLSCATSISAPINDRVSPASSRVLSVSPSNSREPIDIAEQTTHCPVQVSEQSQRQTAQSSGHGINQNDVVAMKKTLKASQVREPMKKKISSTNANTSNTNGGTSSDKNTPRAGSFGVSADVNDPNIQTDPPPRKKSKGGRKKKLITHDEMVARKNRSKERNRVAAKRCRQKRKQFLDELRDRIDELQEMNTKLQKENSLLKSELETLRRQQSAK